jgi:hypothetical protein
MNSMSYSSLMSGYVLEPNQYTEQFAGIDRIKVVGMCEEAQVDVSVYKIQWSLSGLTPGAKHLIQLV